MPPKLTESRIFPQGLLDIHDELLVDLFAGGGGASLGIEMATGRQVDVAINHDKAAVSMHEANHPQTHHLVTDVFEVDPRMVTQGRPVGLLWASPDCTFHSKARGGKPIRSGVRKRRALAWVVTRWAGQVRPRVIMLENVEEFAQWGPLVGPPDALKPCKKRKGESFKKWVRSLTRHGYVVEWRELRSCDYGAPTIRKRLYLIARCDGEPIVWPEKTHAPTESLEVKSRKLKPYRAAAECIDWTHPMCSIFATKEEARDWGKAHNQPSPIRPLAENTNRRIARGVMRYVVNNPKPFLVNVANSKTTGRGPNTWDTDEPLRTVTSANGFAVVSPHITKFHKGETGHEATSPLHTITSNSFEKRPGGAVPIGIVGAQLAPFAATIAHSDESPSGVKRRGKGVRSLEEPHGTQACTNDTAVVAPLIAHVTHQGDRGTPAASEPLGTITCAHRGEFGLIAPSLFPRYGEREGQEPRTRSVKQPAPTVVPSGNGAQLLAANLNAYYGGAQGEARAAELGEPLHTQTTENRHAVVASFLAQNNEGFYKGDGRDLAEPNGAVCANGSLQSLVSASLITNTSGHSGSGADEPTPTATAGNHQGVVASSLVKLKGTSTDANPVEPLDTINAGGQHHGLAAVHIQRDFGQSVGHEADVPIGTITADRGGHAGLVASFLQTYYGQGVGQKADEPLRTIPTIDNFGLVTVQVGDQTYYIEDIAMRMLQPRELYLCQGFHPGYVIDRGADGKPLTKTEQVRMVGNSVSPQVACALAAANVPELKARKEVA